MSKKKFESIFALGNSKGSFICLASRETGVPGGEKKPEDGGIIGDEGGVEEDFLLWLKAVCIFGEDGMACFIVFVSSTDRLNLSAN
jgi:hypothetical protein